VTTFSMAAAKASAEMPKAHEACDRLTARQRVDNAAGNFANMTTGYGILNLAPYIFDISLRIDPALVGLTLAAPRHLRHPYLQSGLTNSGTWTRTSLENSNADFSSPSPP
jgi:hypothetical protein